MITKKKMQIINQSDQGGYPPTLSTEALSFGAMNDFTPSIQADVYNPDPNFADYQ